MCIRLESLSNLQTSNGLLIANYALGSTSTAEGPIYNRNSTLDPSGPFRRVTWMALRVEVVLLNIPLSELASHVRAHKDVYLDGV